ncbi:hypothetical protein GCM10009533_58420 [Saccharopolyspora spinosporotrichia]|uniref:Uncharacterized protein n=1 Tax=Saccharopolyspora erythraea TaxID=1836 RepID=A0ABP3NTH6_SACER
MTVLLTDRPPPLSSLHQALPRPQPQYPEDGHDSTAAAPGSDLLRRPPEWARGQSGKIDRNASADG